MADVDVKTKSSNQSSEVKKGELQRQGGRGEVSYRGEWNPLFPLNPAEFFYNPFGVMRRMSEEMDRSFTRLFGQTGGASAWLPAIDVEEHEGQLRVCADLPGLKPEDIRVEVTEDALIIRGERKSEQEYRKGQGYHSERQYGEFYRRIALPEGADAEQAKAQFHEGVLEITIPVPQQAAKRRQIPVQSGGASGKAAAASQNK